MLKSNGIYQIKNINMKAWRVKKRRVIRWDRIFNTVIAVVFGIVVAGSVIKHSALLNSKSVPIPSPTVIPTLTPTITPTAKPQKRIFKGFVSHYSRSGCLGCNKDLITASGEILSDTDLTIAFNHLPMGTKVLVKNTSNNKSVEARVNDTGGFEALGRIADLNLAVKDAIGSKTDNSIIEIIPLEK